VWLSDDDSLPRFLIATHNPSFADLARARTAKIDGCCGISQGLQVQTYSGEPVSPCKFARNLLTKECWRSMLADKAFKGGPEVTLVCGAKLLSCRAE
jgi:hypothetical protein